MDELIVDGKNVLKPADFDKNKKEMIALKNMLPEDVSLKSFKENVGFFRANVKGDDLNDLVGQLQTCFTQINQREQKFYDEFGTVFNAFESLDKGYIEGIIIGVKSAQKASEQAGYAIEKINQTLQILSKFKQKLEDNTKHLDDIDYIWDETQSLVNKCKQIEKDLEGKVKHINSTISELAKFQKNIEKCKHINDVDQMFQNIKNLSSEVKSNEKHNSEKMEKALQTINELLAFRKIVEAIEHLSEVDQLWETSNTLLENQQKTDLKLKANDQEIIDIKTRHDNFKENITNEIVEINQFTSVLKGYEHLQDIDSSWEYSQQLGKRAEKLEHGASVMNQSISEIIAYTDELKSILHLKDIDSEWEYTQALGKKQDETNNKVLELESKQFEDINHLQNKLKNTYYLLGGIAAIVVLQFILNLMGII